MWLFKKKDKSKLGLVEDQTKSKANKWEEKTKELKVTQCDVIVVMKDGNKYKWREKSHINNYWGVPQMDKPPRIFLDDPTLTFTDEEGSLVTLHTEDISLLIQTKEVDSGEVEKATYMVKVDEEK